MILTFLLDAFATSLKQSKGRPKYSFYDGPPFATGKPHYGHILAGTIKVFLLFYVVKLQYDWGLSDCHVHTSYPFYTHTRLRQFRMSEELFLLP